MRSALPLENEPSTAPARMSGAVSPSARESARTRKAFAVKLDEVIEMMADQLPDLPRQAARARAIAALSTMAGALVLSRVAGTGEFSDEILDAGREAVLGPVAKAPAKKPRAKTS